MLEETTYYVENLSRMDFRFNSEVGKIRLEPYGYVGSITQIKPELYQDPYLKRAIARNRLRELTPEQVKRRNAELVIREDADEFDVLGHNLTEDAANKSSRYTKDLPDEAEPQRSIPAEEILRTTRSARPAARRSVTPAAAATPSAADSDAVVLPSPTDVDVTRAMADPASVLTPRETD